MIAGFRPTLAREGLRLTMQFFFDFFPIVAFFVAYKLKGIYVATGVILIASVIQIAVHWIRTRSVSRMHLTSAGLVLLFDERHGPGGHVVCPRQSPVRAVLLACHRRHSIRQRQFRTGPDL